MSRETGKKRNWWQGGIALTLAIGVSGTAMVPQVLAADAVVATTAITNKLDPHKTRGTAGTLFTANVFDTLITFNPTPSDGRGRHIPEIATSWTIAPDGKSIEFTIRQDGYFHNGERLTAEDVVFSINRIADPKTRHPYRRSYFSYLKNAEVLSPTKIRINYSTAKAAAAQLDAAASRIDVVPKAYIEKVGAEGFAEKPIGSGPYAMKSYRPGDRIELVANKRYWAGKPSFEKVTWRAVPDINTRVAMLCSGEADAITDIPPSLVTTVRRCNANVEVLRGVHQRILQINSLQGGPLADRRVRLALNIAIDRDAVFSAIFGQNAKVKRVNGPLSSYHIGGNAVKPYAYDPERAKKLLAEAGFSKGFSTEVYYTPGRYVGDSELLPILVSYWKKIGVNVQTRPVEYNQWLNYMKKKGFSGMLSFSKGAGIVAEPYSAFSRHVMCGGLFSSFCNKKLDTLLKTAKGVNDKDKLNQIFSKAQRIGHDEAVAIFLYDLPTIFGWKKGLTWRGEYGGGELNSDWTLLKAN